MNLGKKTVVMGVGNELCSDDGVGVHVVRELQKEPIPGIEFIDAGTAILHALTFAEKAGRLVIIDAVHGGRAPGSVYAMDASDATQPTAFASIHSMSLLQTLKYLGSGYRPDAIAIVGVEPASLDYGMELTPDVQAAVPQVVDWVRREVSTLKHDCDTRGRQ